MRVSSYKNNFRLFLYEKRDLNILTNDILPLWDSMRMQTGQRNQTFASLTEAQAYVNNPQSRIRLELF
jgi:hypothetical protein